MGRKHFQTTLTLKICLLLAGDVCRWFVSESKYEPTPLCRHNIDIIYRELRCMIPFYLIKAVKYIH